MDDNAGDTGNVVETKSMCNLANNESTPRGGAANLTNQSSTAKKPEKQVKTDKTNVPTRPPAAKSEQGQSPHSQQSVITAACTCSHTSKRL